jgi:hypothetical protein
MPRRRTRQRGMATGWSEQRTGRKTPTETSLDTVRQEEMPGMLKKRRIKKGGWKQEGERSIGDCLERV